MSFEADRELRAELQAGERLLWSGKPRAGVRLVAADTVMIPFSLLWGGFALYWEYTVIDQGAPLLFALFGVPFVLLGLHLIVGRFLWDAYRRSRTYYGLTNRRILVLSAARTRRLRSLGLGSLPEVNLSERGDGSGTVWFGPGYGPRATLVGTGWPGLDRHLALRFEGLEDAREVHDRILAAQETAVRERA